MSCEIQPRFVYLAGELATHAGAQGTKAVIKPPLLSAAGICLLLSLDLTKNNKKNQVFGRPRSLSVLTDLKIGVHLTPFMKDVLQ